MGQLGDQLRRAVLRWCGIELSCDGKSILKYNPGPYQSAMNFLLAVPFLPCFLTPPHGVQLMALFAIMHTYWWLISDATADGLGYVDGVVMACYENMAALSRFVLGLFVSLVLSRTYFRNRGYFDTIYANSLGLAQFIVSWVRPPAQLSRDPAAKACAQKARNMLIRWINAGFYLIWLESLPDANAKYIGDQILKEELLTQKEWDKIEPLKSRGTHLFQWITNVLTDLYDKGYISNGNQLTMMQTKVDQMRSVNAWGYPSLPLPYTQIITVMVKMHLSMMAISHGGMANGSWMHAMNIKALVIIHLDVVIHNYLFQGLLDLHGALYHPNMGVLMGHMPSLDFIQLVRDVTHRLESENQTMPYELELVETGSPSTLRDVAGLHSSESTSERQANGAQIALDCLEHCDV